MVIAGIAKTEAIRERTRLIVALARQELLDRFAGSALGIAWALLHPLFLLTVLVVVFGHVLNVPGAGPESVGARGFTLYVLAGYVPWLAVQDALSRSCSAVVGSSALVKQIAFPLDVLPMKSALVSLIPQGVGFIVYCLLCLWQTHSLPATIGLAVVAFAIEALGLAGLSYILASLSVFLRDLREILAVFTLMGLYLTPIVYPPALIVEKVGAGLAWNPISHLVWIWQDVLFFGAIEHPWSWGIALGTSCVLFWMGRRVFSRLRPFFGNAL